MVLKLMNNLILCFNFVSKSLISKFENLKKKSNQIKILNYRIKILNEKIYSLFKFQFRVFAILTIVEHNFVDKKTKLQRLIIDDTDGK